MGFIYIYIYIVYERNFLAIKTLKLLGNKYLPTIKTKNTNSNIANVISLIK